MTDNNIQKEQKEVEFVLTPSEYRVLKAVLDLDSFTLEGLSESVGASEESINETLNKFLSEGFVVHTTENTFYASKHGKLRFNLMQDIYENMPDMTPAQYCIVSALTEMGCSTSQELADKLGVDKRRAAAAVASCRRMSFVVPAGYNSWSTTIRGYKAFVRADMILREKEMNHEQNILKN